MFKQNFIIGNTPMIKINYKYKEKNKQIFVKLEYYNFKCKSERNFKRKTTFNRSNQWKYRNFIISTGGLL